MKVFYSALFLVLLHGMAHAQCDDFALTVNDVQPPSCPNASDGAITLSAAGAQGMVSYAWTETGLSGPSVSGLAPGTYSVTATDDAGCQAVETVALEAALAADAGPDVEAYCGAESVSLGGAAITEISFSSDITPIEFSDSNQEIVPFRGISGEVGFAPAPDSFDPASSDSLYVEIGSATASVGDVVCLPVRVYNFTDIVGAAFTINYDSAHLNFIEVTGLNPNLPGFTAAFNIATPNNGLNAGFIILNYFEQSLSGVSLSDGSTLFTLCFEVAGISGTSVGPNITYQWTGPSNFTISELFPQVTEPGVYTLRVTDTSQPDCWAEDEVEVIFQPDSIGLVLTDTITPCHSQPVLLEPEISGGQQPFSFLWSTGDTTQSLTVNSIDIPVDYSLTVTSSDGCTGLASARVEAESGPPPFIDIGPDQPFCSGQSVLLAATATGGAMPYTYIWNDGLVTSNPNRILNPSVDTTYWVNVVDANGCSNPAGPDSLMVIQLPPSDVELGPDQHICPGEQVVLTPFVSGEPAIAYSWSNGQTGAIITVQPSQTTTYSLTITNSSGCFSSDEVEINVGGPIITAAAPDCNDNGTPFNPDDDTFTFLASIIGTPGGSWVSNLGPSGSYGQAVNFGPFPVSGGDVTLIVTDASDPACSNNTVAPAPAPCSASSTCLLIATITTTLCIGEGTPGNPADDSLLVALLVDGGPGIGWNSNYPGASDVYGNVDTLAFALSDGPVNLTIYDHDDPGCDTTLVIDPEALCSPPCNLQAVVQEVFCDDNGTPTDTTDDTFTLDILVTGGTGSGWVEDSSGLSGSYGLPFTFGSYPADYGHVGLAFRDADSSLCVKAFDLYTPVPCSNDCQNNPLVLNFDVVFPFCAGASDGEAFAIVEGGAGGYTYEWSNGVTSFDNTGLSAGVYGLTVTDIFGCQATGLATLSEPPPLTLTLTASNVTCQGGSDGTITVFVTGGTPPYWYDWSGVGGNVPTLGGLTAGVYSVTVTDVNNCSIIEEVAITEPAESLVAPASIDQQPTCPTSNDGVLSVSASGGNGPYEYIWSTGFTGPVHSGLNHGAYSVTVTDFSGCSVVETIFLESALVADAGPAQVVNCISGTAALDGSGSSSGPDITYQWLGPNNFTSSELFPQVTEPGTYLLQVTNSAEPNCLAEDIVVVSEAMLTPSISMNQVSCDSAVIAYTLPGQGLEATWTLPDGSQSIESFLEATQSGYYYLEVFDPVNGCSAQASILLDLDPSQCATLKGRLVRDTVPDCIPAANEPGLANWLIVIQNGSQFFYAVTQADGYYEQSAPIGDYEVYPIIPGPLWLPCQDGYSVSLQQPGEMAVQDIPVQESEPCPELSVELSMPLLRQCWTRSIPVSYCNDGTAPADGAYVVVTLDDFFAFDYATAPLLSQDGNEYTFGIGDVAPGQCGTFYIYVEVSCDAVVGQTLCAEAKIFPNGPCFPPSPNWSGASLQVEAFCEGGEVQFRIENVGSGDMPQALPCIVIEDGVMLLTSPDSIQLNSGESFTYTFPANGSTYRIEVEQEPFHPGQSMPAAVLEGCGVNEQGTFSTGFVNQFALDDAGSFIDVECREVVASYDPNDKHGFPRGYGAENFIYPGTDIEYLVQFQNTGNDTAFLVVIRDTLSEFLDITTVQPGAASHPYTWDIDSNNILVFTFDNILLPDSTTNLEGSQGFIEFKVAQQGGLPLGTVIENSAAIYFGLNDPVATNTTLHTLGYGFIELVNFTSEAGIQELRARVAPNPVDEWALFRLEGWQGGEGLFELFGPQGRRLREQRFSGAELRFERRGLSAGFYTFRVVDERGRWGSGKLIIR
ncbi:MAG: hypothetical protein H6560_17320 [Lewinellaceae bacterium]|nr:hypothetical protein [Lewinellaceae bacterium]